MEEESTHITLLTYHGAMDVMVTFVLCVKSTFGDVVFVRTQAFDQENGRFGKERIKRNPKILIAVAKLSLEILSRKTEDLFFTYTLKEITALAKAKLASD